MRGSAPRSNHGRATIVVVGILAAFLIAVVVMMLDLGGRENDTTATTSVAVVATTAPQVTTTTRGEVIYTVVPGDTLLTIAEQFGMTTEKIIQANQFPDPDNLLAGQVIRISAITTASIVVKPATVKVGKSVVLKLRGADPGENVTFEIQGPAGTFKGQPHRVSDAGEYFTSYKIDAADPPGTYTVIVTGDEDTNVQTTFTVIPRPAPAG